MVTELTFRNFSASICVNGTPLTVYQCAYDEERKTATCWIPSEAGQKYSVRLRAEKDIGCSDCGWTSIDGARNVLAIVGEQKQVGTWCTRKGAPVTKDTIRPLQFGRIEVSDDASLCDAGAGNQRLGTVRIKVTRVVVRAQQSASEWKFAEGLSSEPLKLHETTKKAGHHVTVYGIPERERSRNCTVTPFSDADKDGPYVTFIFKYRSCDFLEAEGIIPSGASKKRGREKEEGREEDIKQKKAKSTAVQLKVETLTKEIKKKKRKVNESQVDAKKVKEELGRASTSRTRASRGTGTQDDPEIIDLSGDEMDCQELIDLTQE